jgi:hypothetical protein
VDSTAIPPPISDSKPSTAQTTETQPSFAATLIVKSSTITLNTTQSETETKTRKLMTPAEAKLLQSAEEGPASLHHRFTLTSHQQSLKPVGERDIGPGSFVARAMAAAARNVKAGLVEGSATQKIEKKPETKNETKAGWDVRVTSEQGAAGLEEAGKRIGSGEFGKETQGKALGAQVVVNEKS